MKRSILLSVILLISFLAPVNAAPDWGDEPVGQPPTVAEMKPVTPVIEAPGVYAPGGVPVTGPQGVIVMRVYFNDYAATTRYTLAQVEGMFTDLDKLWQNISYGDMSIDYQVTDLYQLPENRDAYIDDGGDVGTCAETSGGDLSCGEKFWNVLRDAIDNAPGTLDWSDIQAVMVVMAETDATQFHRGQGSSSCNLHMGAGGPIANVGCAIFSENPTESDRQVWGRWAHEIGHAFQQAGPAHPSNYNSEFELMDSNYPGQIGTYEKQSHVGYPGWMPEDKYQTFTPNCSVGPDPCTGVGGGTAYLWAMEYDPLDKPNKQAAIAYITDNLYYMISVRRRVNGDELNGGFPLGIPDEGVLIERVEQGASQVVTIQGNPTRNDLWHQLETYTNASDGIIIGVGKMVDADNYEVRIAYDQEMSFQPDVMLYPWTSPPGNTWETTDIWVDSPVNGYGTYRYGIWNDLDGNPVPRGNGDDPALGLVNRLYARVRNIGGAPASDVVVNFEITDPPGLGIAGALGWAPLGEVKSATFPDLANIDPGEFVDVYLEWTPNFAPPADGTDAGSFAYHTCLRVTLDHVVNETVFGNQDGDMEQENIFYFEVPESTDPAPAYDALIHLQNDSEKESRYFALDWQSNLPKDWTVKLNEGKPGIELGPGEKIDIPLFIEPPAGYTGTIGVVGAVEVRAAWHRLFVSDLDPKDQHPWFEEYGGVVVQAAYQEETKLDCTVRESDQGVFYVRCHLDGIKEYYDPKNPFRVLVQAIGRSPTGARIFLPGISLLLLVDEEGNAEGYLHLSGLDALGELAAEEVVEVVGMFSGSQYLTGSASGYLLVDPVLIHLPYVMR